MNKAKNIYLKHGGKITMSANPQAEYLADYAAQLQGELEKYKRHVVQIQDQTKKMTRDMRAIHREMKSALPDLIDPFERVLDQTGTVNRAAGNVYSDMASLLNYLDTLEKEANSAQG